MADIPMNEVVIAAQIEDCQGCPLYQEDCPGGWTSGPGGTPIEPPCTSWNGDEEIYAGMYEREVDYPLQSIRWAEEARARREQEEAERRRRKEIEDTREAVFSISKHGNAKRRKSEWHEWEDWFCPECNRWFHVGVLSFSNGIETTGCQRCGAPLAYSPLLEQEG